MDTEDGADAPQATATSISWHSALFPTAPFLPVHTGARWPISEAPVSCNCHSYNGDFGATPEVQVELPAFVQLEQQRQNTTVCIDACIAETVKRLWGRGVVTLSSCCGHDKRSPSLVLGDSENPCHCAGLLSVIDPRPWELWQWRDGVNEIRARVEPKTPEVCSRPYDRDVCQASQPQEVWCPACRVSQGTFLQFEQLVQGDSDALRRIFDRLVNEGCEPLSVAASGCTCYPSENTGAGHRGNCPAREPECTCYELIGGHQPGCAFHGRATL